MANGCVNKPIVELIGIYQGTRTIAPGRKNSGYLLKGNRAFKDTTATQNHEWTLEGQEFLNLTSEWASGKDSLGN